MIMFYPLFGQTSVSVGGDWHTSSTWIGGSIPATNNSTIFVDGPVESYLDLILNNNISLTINENDTLIVNGDLEFNNGANFVISAGAVVIVRGNFVSNNNLELDANAYLIVLGDLTLNNNSTVNSSTEPSQVFVGGAADWGNGTEGNVLDCSGSDYNSGCNFGNIVDLVNDSIFGSISEDCTPAPYYNVNGEPSSNSPVELGDTLLLLADPNPGSGASFVNYVWTGSNSFAYSSQVIPNTSLEPVDSTMGGEYIFAAFTDEGCYLIDTIDVVVISGCDAGVIGTNNSVCFNDVAPKINDISSPIPVGSITINWYKSENSTDPTSGTWTLVADSIRDELYPGSLEQTTSFYRLINAGGCLDTSNVVTVTVNPLPAATITVANDSVCSGTKPIITIDFTTPATHWDLTINDGTNPEENINVLAEDEPFDYIPNVAPVWDDNGTPVTEYVYSIQITDSNGCVNTISSPVIYVFKIPETGPQYHIANDWNH